MLIIPVDNNNIEKALKQYKRKVIKTKQLKKIRDRKDFTKAEKRLQLQKAKYVNRSIQTD